MSSNGRARGSRSSSQRRSRKKRKRRDRERRARVAGTRRREKARLRKIRARGWPWWKKWPAEFDALRSKMPDEYLETFEGVVVGKAIVFRGIVDVPHSRQQRRIAIVFPGRPKSHRPQVMVDGPRTKRHRFNHYRPLPLCIWYASDPDGLRWTPEMGLVGLIDLARLHLAKEAWFRATSEWPGQEVHRQPELLSGPRDLGPRKRAKAAVRRQRQQCWCGVKKYRTCHGRRERRDEELITLGLKDPPREDRG